MGWGRGERGCVEELEEDRVLTRPCLSPRAPAAAAAAVGKPSSVAVAASLPGRAVAAHLFVSGSIQQRCMLTEERTGKKEKAKERRDSYKHTLKLLRPNLIDPEGV